MTLAEEFHRLFAGLERSHGRYVVPAGAKPNAQNKLHDTKWAVTVHERVTVTTWELHLAGTSGLGVVPIRDDATCVFGAIDLDPHDAKGNYVPMDLPALAASVVRLGLPLVACRTKSGGAHLYLFLKEPVPADVVRSRLLEWAVALGHPGSEIFPKQTRLASEKDDGSWINMPYQSGARSTRYALHDDGTAMTPEEFIATADRTAITKAELIAFVMPPDEEFGDLLEGAPPCLQTLAKQGFGNWEQNGLFNIAIYLRKRYPDNWESRIIEYNQKVLDVMAPFDVVRSTIKSVAKKSYSYMCKQEPICGVCNRQVCLSREFGIGTGGGEDDPGVVFGEILKLETEPPTYIWDVNGARLELSVDDLMDQRRFHKLVINTLSIWPSMVKAGAWQDIVRERLSRLTTAQVPEDATKEGQFWVHVQRFCTSRTRGRSMDELLLGKPYTDVAVGRTYFCSADLFQYLTQHRFSGATEKDVYRWLRDREVEHHFSILKGKGLNYWSLPAFQEQTEPHGVPRGAPPEKM